MAVKTLFNMIRDINGYNGFGLPFSVDKFFGVLPGKSAQSITTPSFSSQYLAIFSFEPGSIVWVANNQTAILPVGTTLGTSVSELNPTARLVNAGDILSFITSDTTAKMGVTFYALQ